MDFVNSQVSAHELPRYSGVSYTPLAERVARVRLAVVGIVYFVLFLAFVIPMVVIIQFNSEAGASLLRPVSLTIFLIVLLLMALLAWFVFASTRAIHYALRQHDVIVKSGVFWKQEVIQPLKRVQHVEVTRGPLDKRYGLANVKLFSAGTSKSTFRIPGIEHEQAEQIRQFVLDYQAASSEATERLPE
ncbi:MAG TPA: hypothetical protein DCM64_01210 [Gammaproteobacteria bacterium]|jgi:hypothetical protein|nr:PH domain-containing protein [Gammaproteobacteria bacterium]MDP6731878.1 PH domain-containing protein [Gammaproteobacteria bacterium]HAJ75051.1 hypothetical protein [Gammaproteobacteria bacterium]|tara:strand:- start:2631 stop:3194 length:564 start_codon:yes stop_codon:yes gene_type:complete